MNHRIVALLFLLYAAPQFAFSQTSTRPAAPSVRVLSSTVLSTNGSTRATAYSMSNKIITADGKIFVAWLDMPSNIQIKAYDIAADRWSETVLLGKGVDNHSGPAMTMDGDGYLYAVFGPHHGPFQFRRSAKPYDISKWQAVQYFGVTATYPSLVCDAQGTLHCTYRGGPEPWRLMYQRQPKGGEWSEPMELVHSGVKDGYTQYGNPLMLAPDGTLHLAFHIYDMHPAAGKSIGYLRSRDGGRTWENAAGEKMALPVTPESACFIEQGDSLDMRASNLAIDADGQPWMLAFHNDRRPRTLLLWHHDGRTWQSRDLLPVIQQTFSEWEITYGTATFDRDGRLYIAAVIQYANAPKFWGDKSLETVLLVSGNRGKTFQTLPISQQDPEQPNWLPSIERPYGTKPIGVPAFLYTHGGPGTSVTEGDSTEVIFVRLGR